MKTACFNDKNAALAYLLEKYRVSGTGKITGSCLEAGGRNIPLLPWRLERRFTELRSLIANRTLEDVSTLRFARLTTGIENLDELIFQELDLCEWLGASPVSRLFAVFSGRRAVNIIARLENGISTSVECSVMLPKNAAPLSRHEIIARRGVASDQVVDVQVPQSSIYTYTAEKAECFTDVDAEIFGLSQSDAHLVRAAFKVLSAAETAAEWTTQDLHIKELINEAKQSEANGKPSISKAGRKL
ncbi:MAG: hypothetical protein PHV82_03530 [Victivallaceae bacterium]|nr:hypothetical protein [Victivallaceae bacterium]